MTDYFQLPEEEPERRVNDAGRRILELCAEKALARDEGCIKLMEIFALHAKKNGNQDIIDAYRLQRRRQMN